jgi:mannose-6-phosphate isomerase-like protein (cupin superfamily)
MIIKLKKGQKVVQTKCGNVHEILSGGEYSPNISFVPNIRQTVGHYHTGFDEIYFVLDGRLVIKFYDPNTDKFEEHELHRNELVIISKGIHHKVIKSSDRNRLCVITVPKYDANDEKISEII